jgi:hypothetical protein
MDLKRFILVFGVVFLALAVGIFLGCQQNQPTAPQADERSDIISLSAASTTGCTCVAGCDSREAISSGFSFGGPGEYCWEATDLGSYVQSWGCDVLEISGVDYTNKYVPTGDLLRDTDGKYYIYYKAGDYGHFHTTGESIIACCPGGCNARWCSCEQWGEMDFDGFTIYNNLWGPEEGSQCVWANSYNDWGVHAEYPETGGVKTYPNVSKILNTNISALGSCTSSFSVSVPSSGSFCTTYDIWVPNEIMIWMNKTGAVGPIAEGWDDQGNPIPSETNVSVGGHTWSVYHGPGASTQTISFVRTSNTTSGSVDILAILNWIKNKGWIGNGPVEELQFGFEITSAPGGLDFTVNDYSLSVGGSGTTTTTTTAATTTTTAATTTTTAATTSTTTTSATTSTTTTAATTSTTTTATTTTTSATTTTTSGTGETCSPVDAAISAPFTQNGAGEYCWTATSCNYINSWNLSSLTINGVDFTNKYAFGSNLPAKIDGKWYIHYEGNYAWSHFELR